MERVPAPSAARSPSTGLSLPDARKPAGIIRTSSNEGDWVLDPFCGSGTTAVVAHKLKRLYTTTDLSESYADAARRRIADARGLPVEEKDADWPPHTDAETRLALWREQDHAQQSAAEPVPSWFCSRRNSTSAICRGSVTTRPSRSAGGSSSLETVSVLSKQRRHWKWGHPPLKDKNPLERRDVEALGTRERSPSA